MPHTAVYLSESELVIGKAGNAICLAKQILYYGTVLLGNAFIIIDTGIG